MIRKCRIFDISEFIEAYPELKSKNIQIWVDRDEENEILDFIFEQKKDGSYIRKDHFIIILYTIFQSGYDEDLYYWELKEERVTAMKFKGKSNIRIGCKEIYENGKKIVMICLISKKVRKNNNTIKQRYKAIGNYEYEFNK
jgi:hypothetical protein